MGDFNVYLLVAQYNISININPLIHLSMFDYTAIIVAIITSISTIAGIYLKEWLFPKRKEQKLTIEKSNCYIELDKICASIRDTIHANAVEEGSLIMQPYRSYFVGPMTKYSELVTYTESIHMFGVRFLPCGLSCFTNLPLHEFVNSRVSTNEMKAVFDDTFIEKLGEQKHVTDRIRVVEEYLLAYLARHYQPADSHVAMAVNMINHSKGKRSVRSLMDDVCLCQRHFERKFKHYTGFTPKEYSRIVKFKNAVELLRTTTSANLLTTAVDAGYYDLAHFSKEIKSMSGNTPASFLSLTVPEETTLTYIEPQR